MPQRLTYKDAGVDMDAGDKVVDLIRTAVTRTHSTRVVDLYGHFAGVFALDFPERILRRNYKRPLLVAGTDGVGTKLRVAIDAGRFDTIGQDCVAMCVNDILCLGAEPLFFLDYLGTGHVEPDALAETVIGVANACADCDCALLGGETAEMPGFYAKGDLDLAGFAVGVVEKSRLIDGSRIEEGDTVLGLASSGIHSNGFSLVRKIVFDVAGLKVNEEIPGLGISVADELLKPTRLYPRPVLRVLHHYQRKRVVHGLAHITGGGIVGNVPRVIPAGLRAEISRKAWTVPPIFGWLQKVGNVPTQEMGRVFNMGIGFVLVVSPYYADHVAEMLETGGETVYRLGRIARGPGGIALR